MLISEIRLKNFKSFGNNIQKLILNTKRGELILLAGENGAGKSSLISAFEYVFYNKVKGRKKKWVTLADLPNRINNQLEVGIDFKSSGTEITVDRGQNPGKLVLTENGVINDRAGKTNLDDKIQKYIGMDIETFKSFISMSINDFKNFIDLSNEDKELLLDKLFNLDVINTLDDILKGLVKNNKNDLSKLSGEINALNESITSIRESIDKTKAIDDLKKKEQIAQIKLDMNSKKESYVKLKEKIDKIKAKDVIITGELEKENKSIIQLKSEISQIESQLDVYDIGKCPTCMSDLSTDFHVGIKIDLVNKKEAIKKLVIENTNNYNALKVNKTKLTSINNETTALFNDLTFTLRSLKTKLDSLTADDEDSTKKQSMQEFENSLTELTTKKEQSSDKYSENKDKEEYYKQLSKIFSDDGVKKTIITGIIKPINHFIKENVKLMRKPFEVELDETFTAEIKSFGQIIDPETLSVGEAKSINLSIMVAYLKLIRTKRHINVLFLDEVFASIDVNSINYILELMRNFANDYNINIFLVHHAILNKEYFDRVIKINKNIFTSLEEVTDESLAADKVEAE
jgi:DNA repair exonuclease SbcCD ATPase subunit